MSATAPRLLAGFNATRPVAGPVGCRRPCGSFPQLRCDEGEQQRGGGEESERGMF